MGLRDSASYAATVDLSAREAVSMNPQQPLPPKRRRPGLVPGLIGGAAVLVALVLVVVFVVVPGGRSDQVSGQAEAAGAGGGSDGGNGGPPADGVYLTQQPGTRPPPKWNSTPITNACAVLPLSEVLKEGITFDGAYELFDVGVPHDVQSVSKVGAIIYDAGGGSDGITNCLYPGDSNTDDIVVQVFQAPEAVADAISAFNIISTDTAGSEKQTVGGWQVVTVPLKDDKNSWQVGFTDTGHKYFAELDITLRKAGYAGHTPQQVIADFATTIRQNLDKSPLPAPTYHYAAPYAQVPDPCDLFTADDFTTLTGKQDDIVNRKFQFGERGVNPDPGINLPDANYTEMSCERDTIGAVTESASDGDAFGIHVDVEVFRNAQQARTGMYAECDPRSSGAKVFGPSVQVSLKIGDDRVCFPDEGRNDWRMTFRSGRVVIFMQNVAMLQKSQLQNEANVFAPTARQMAAQVAGL
ncbi:MAG TPA: hypothetical protein VGG05_11310 [Pseudonocardiaceae bacterium]|jgi:hypothetical protein